jgi:hypothetical protein
MLDTGSGDSGRAVLTHVDGPGPRLGRVGLLRLGPSLPYLRLSVYLKPYYRSPTFVKVPTFVKNFFSDLNSCSIP